MVGERGVEDLVLEFVVGGGGVSWVEDYFVSVGGGKWGVRTA